METIVRGKHLKYHYSVSSIFDPWLFSHCNHSRFYGGFGYYYLNNTEKIERINYEIHRLRDSINLLNEFNIKTYIETNKEIIDYETFYSSKDLEFQLHDNNLLHINGEIYKIEKIEGTDQNQIIYYTDKELSIIDDIKQYKETESQIKEKLNNKIIFLEACIEEYEKDIQKIVDEMNHKVHKSDEVLKEAEKEVDSWIKKLKRKVCKNK